MLEVVISFQQNKRSSDRSLLFTSKSKHNRFFVVLFFSLIMMLGDVKTSVLMPLRDALSFCFFPVAYLIDLPALVWKKSLLLYAEKKALLSDIETLKKENLMLRVQLQETSVLKNHRQLLMHLLKFANASEYKMFGARILNFSSDQHRHFVLIDRGKKDHVAVGFPVLDAFGVMGQVIETHRNYSIVMLLSDPFSAVPVKNIRTHERAIVVGNGRKNRLSCLHLPKTSSVQIGDQLITSGLGQRYPEGYPVGQVVSVHAQSDSEFMKVDIRPFSALTQSDMVLLLDTAAKG